MTDNNNSMEPIEIQWLNASGQGGCKTKDSVISVIGAVPGDVVTWDRLTTKGRHIHATIREILSPSPSRTRPPCVFDASCGGCDLSYLARDARKQELTKVAENALRTPLVHWVDSPRQTHHRARVKLGISVGNWATAVRVPTTSCPLSTALLRERKSTTP